MEYRVLPHGGEQVSVIGMGSSVIGAQPEKEITATVRAAVDSGVNYFDMAGGHAAIFAAYGKALEGIRDKVYLQIHFGADYTSGEYGWTTELAEVKRSVACSWSSCGRTISTWASSTVWTRRATLPLIRQTACWTMCWR